MENFLYLKFFFWSPAIATGYNICVVSIIQTVDFARSYYSCENIEGVILEKERINTTVG